MKWNLRPIFITTSYHIQPYWNSRLCTQKNLRILKMDSYFCLQFQDVSSYADKNQVTSGHFHIGASTYKIEGAGVCNLGLKTLFSTHFTREKSITMDFFIDYDGHWPQAWPPFKKKFCCILDEWFPFKKRFHFLRVKNMKKEIFTLIWVLLLMEFKRNLIFSNWNTFIKIRYT